VTVPYETPCFHSFQHLQRESFLSGSHISAVFARFSGLFPPLGSLVAYPVGFGKGPCLSNGAAHSLTQGVVPPFHMRSLPSFLPNTMMGFSREHVLVGMPKITEGVAVLVVIWKALPQTAAGGKALARQWRTPRFGAFAGTSPSTSIVGDLFCVQNSRFHPLRERHPVSQTEGFL
jgi:hypothetical protein